MNRIKNIIFDFGGVIYDIDYHRSVKEFELLGAENFEQMYSQAVQNSLFERLEVGEITATEFRNELRKSLKASVSDIEIDKAWNALLIGFKKERIDLLLDLKQNYNTYLLSNSNIIHYEVFLKEFQGLTGLKNFDKLFNKAYYSFDIQLRKPDVSAYQYVLEQHQLDPSSCLFIDDSIQNMKPAQEVGIRTYFLDKDQELVDLFKDNLLKLDLEIG